MCSGSACVIAKRSPPRSSTQNPSIAVQKPIEIQPKSAPNTTAIATSSHVRPWYGSTFTMKPLAMMVGRRTSATSRKRRQCAARTHGSARGAGDADGGDHAAGRVPDAGLRATGSAPCPARSAASHRRCRRLPDGIEPGVDARDAPGEVAPSFASARAGAAHGAERLWTRRRRPRWPDRARATAAASRAFAARDAERRQARMRATARGLPVLHSRRPQRNRCARSSTGGARARSGMQGATTSR
jgi:hypothetical protein